MKWHLSFSDISCLVTFQFGLFEFWWHFSFGDNTPMGQLFICVTSQRRLLYTVCNILPTVNWQVLSWSYFDCLAIPRPSPVDFDIPSQGVHPKNKKTVNNEQHPKWRASQDFGLTGWKWEIWRLAIFLWINWLIGNPHHHSWKKNIVSLSLFIRHIGH